MQNLGEEITGQYLKISKDCDFVEYNLYTTEVRGEIDVVGINAKDKKVYICEVAIHLVTGLQYNTKGETGTKPDNVNRFLKKFAKNIEYAEKYFKEYEKTFMLWSPIVKNQSVNAKHNQMDDVLEIQSEIKNRYGHNLELVINEKYQECLDQLREHARKETKELKSPVLRTMQIEEKLKKHLELLKKRCH